MDLGLPLYLTRYCSAWGQFKVIVNIEMFYDESSWNCMLLKTNVCFLQFLFFFERISFHPLFFSIRGSTMLSDPNPPKWDFSPKVTCIQCFAWNNEIKKSYLCITVKHNADVYKTWCTFRVVVFFKIPCRWHTYSNIIFKTIRVQLQGNEEYVNNSSKSTFSLNKNLLLSPLVMPLTSRAHTCTFMGEYFNTCQWLRYLDRG